MTEPTTWQPSEAQKAYWTRMRTKRGPGTPRWRGVAACKTAKHQWLSKNIGTPSICEEPSCKGKSKIYDWALKTGHQYSHDRKDYRRLCRSCHLRYDMSKDKKQKALKNLWWARGIPNPTKKIKPQTNI